MQAGSFTWYNESSDYAWLPGHWLSALDPPGEGEMVYQDSFGVQVAGDFNPLQPSDELPEYIADQLQNLLSQYLSGSRSLVGVVAEIGGNDFSMDIINEMLNPPKPNLLPPGTPLPPSSGTFPTSGVLGHFEQEVLDFFDIIPEAPLIWLKKLSRGFVCTKPKFIGKAYWCYTLANQCAASCGPETLVNLGCVLACHARGQKCQVTGKF